MENLENKVERISNNQSAEENLNVLLQIFPQADVSKLKQIEEDETSLDNCSLISPDDTKSINGLSLIHI